MNDGEEVKNIEEAETSLDVVAPTTPLEDKRRTRTKSVGRPPSQVFRKTALQNSFSMETDHDSEAEDEVDKPTDHYSEKSLNSVIKIVSDMKKSTISSYTSSSSTGSSSGWKNIVLKKTTTVKDGHSEDKTPSWIKELRERKTQKLSLREDELPSLEHEKTTVVEMTQNKDDGYKIVQSTISTTKDGTGPPKIVFSETTTHEEPMRPRRSIRRHTVNANFHEAFPVKPPTVVEPPKNKHLEEVVEKVNNFITHSKNFREKLQQDLYLLETSMNSQFETQVEELEDIKNKVSSLINNHTD